MSGFNITKRTLPSLQKHFWSQKVCGLDGNKRLRSLPFIFQINYLYYKWITTRISPPLLPFYFLLTLFQLLINALLPIWANERIIRLGFLLFQKLNRINSDIPHLSFFFLFFSDTPKKKTGYPLLRKWKSFFPPRELISFPFFFFSLFNGEKYYSLWSFSCVFSSW